MIPTLVATFMWTLVASLLIFRYKRTDRNITYASTGIAVAMTLNINSIYSTLDPLAGGTNTVTLVSDALLMTGIFFLGRAVITTGQYRPRLVRAAISIPVLMVSLAAITTAFCYIAKGATTTTFMIDLGAQPAAAIYSIMMFAYCGVVVIAMMVVAGRQYRHSSGVEHLPTALLGLGSALGLALCASVIAMDIAHVTGHLNIVAAIQPAYDALTLSAFAFLCAGFAVQPIIRHVGNYHRHRQTANLISRLGPLWQRATHVRSSLSQTNPLAVSRKDPERYLHRQIVEIRDAMIDPRVEFHVNSDEVSLLRQAEAHLLGPNQNSTQVPLESESQRNFKERS